MKIRGDRGAAVVGSKMSLTGDYLTGDTTGYFFRGDSFSPIPEPSPLALALTALILTFAKRRTR